MGMMQTFNQLLKLQILLLRTQPLCNQDVKGRENSWLWMQAGLPTLLKAKEGSWNPKWGLHRWFIISSDSSHYSSTNVVKAEVGSLIRAARQMTLSAEVRMCVEYNVKEKRILKSVGKLLKAREEDIGSLKARLLLKEAEAVESIRLHVDASNFETVEKSFRDKANALRERNIILRDALDVKVTDLETSAMSKECQLMDLNALVTSIKSQNDNLVVQFEKFQDDRMKIVEDKFDKLYTDFVEMTLHLEEQFYPHLLTTISGHRWLLTHGIKLAIAKCLNSPEFLSALGTAIGKAIEKADYIFALQQLQNVNFLLFVELKSNKDASVEAIMEILRLEDLVAKKLGLNELQPNVDQLMPFSTSALTGVEGTSGTAFATSTTTALSTTLASISIVNPISIDDYEFIDADDQAIVGGDDASFLNVDDAELHIPQ
nr:hypothetical protein [Tanacetum cinerariifolium]